MPGNVTIRDIHGTQQYYHCKRIDLFKNGKHQQGRIENVQKVTLMHTAAMDVDFDSKEVIKA